MSLFLFDAPAAAAAGTTVYAVFAGTNLEGDGKEYWYKVPYTGDSTDFSDSGSREAFYEWPTVGTQEVSYKCACYDADRDKLIWWINDTAGDDDLVRVNMDGTGYEVLTDAGFPAVAVRRGMFVRGDTLYLAGNSGYIGTLDLTAVPTSIVWTQGSGWSTSRPMSGSAYDDTNFYWGQYGIASAGNIYKAPLGTPYTGTLIVDPDPAGEIYSLAADITGGILYFWKKAYGLSKCDLLTGDNVVNAIVAPSDIDNQSAEWMQFDPTSGHLFVLGGDQIFSIDPDTPSATEHLDTGRGAWGAGGILTRAIGT